MPWMLSRGASWGTIDSGRADSGRRCLYANRKSSYPRDRYGAGVSVRFRAVGSLSGEAVGLRALVDLAHVR
jgi:hypothetical protein